MPRERAVVGVASRPPRTRELKRCTAYAVIDGGVSRPPRTRELKRLRVLAELRIGGRVPRGRVS